MTLRQLASTDAALAWLGQRGARSLSTDSRRVLQGDAFVAWPGYVVDGRRFVPQALAAGASACLVEADGAAEFDWVDTERIAALPHLKARTGELASDFMGTPSRRLHVIAVTGTNGKTSTSWWVAQALTLLGRRCGVIGTLGVGEPPVAGHAAAITFTGMTTPDPVTVQAGFRRFVDAGASACAIEATSIGIAEERLTGSTIDTALFTNLTLDHLDYHGSMQAYADAKDRLFAWPGLRAAVVNIDDAHGAGLARRLPSSLDVWTYSARGSAARLTAARVRYDDGGLRFDLCEADAVVDVRTRLIGDYNVANLLATIGGLRASAVSLADAARVCAELTPVPGRMDRVPSASDAPQVVVDYAHTPDALEKALLALQPFAAQRGGALWCVFGCGGNRDAGKRPVMGGIAARLAQQLIVTSDNPRDEPPGAILRQIGAGIPAGRAQVALIEDRRLAIAQALRLADARDVVLIAGKGHEDYQEIAGSKRHFSDLEEAAAALAARAGSAA